MPGQQCKGRAVDCVRFVTGVLDALHGMPHDGSVKLPQDTALHDAETARAAMRAIMSRYPRHTDVTNGEWVEPGDVVVTGPWGGGPGHAMIVGTDHDLWHATGTRVQRTGLIPEQPVYHILRPDRTRWVNT